MTHERPARSSRDDREERGVVLALVLVITMLLSVAVITFARRATLDAQIAGNRDAAARAEALARGGIQIATFVILKGNAEEDEATDPLPPGDSYLSPWAQLEDSMIELDTGETLQIAVEDSGARLNLNAVLGARAVTDAPGDETIEFLVDFLSKVIDELPLPPGDRFWEPRELAHNLVEYVDEDEERIRGGDEAGWYERQDPPYLPANEPLRTVDELGRVEGFDTTLVEGLRPYITVHPRSGGSGVNLNTAPAHVLATVYHGNQGSRQLANEDTVRRILRARDDGEVLCQESASNDRCVLVGEIVDGSIFPPPGLGEGARIFTITATASAGNISRTIRATLDMSGAPRPLILDWRRL